MLEKTRSPTKFWIENMGSR